VEPNPEHSMAAQTRTAEYLSRPLVSILAAISLSHLLNDMIQSVLPSIYPILKRSFNLSFGQIGIVTLAYQLTASLLQPFIGQYTDRKPMEYLLPGGMCITFAGVLLLAVAPTFPVLLIGSSMLGMGSAIFHPEGSRVARLSSGGRLGLAQSLFQLGGNSGSAIGPLLATFVVLASGQTGVAWFSLAAICGAVILLGVSRWYKGTRQFASIHSKSPLPVAPKLSQRHVHLSIGILAVLILSKYLYLASFTSYYMFFLMNKFNVSLKQAQLHLFLFLGAVALGTLVGGPVGDRLGRRIVIWCSILGVLPFSLLLPHANLFWTGMLSCVIGLVIASAFSAILVYAQELVPGKVGLISGLFFGFAFGMGGIGAASLGILADHTSVIFVYKVCAYLPAIGLLTGLLPDDKSGRLADGGDLLPEI
jgi:FSR family fosmidomycin resistance protein-like MFS transporter